MALVDELQALAIQAQAAAVKQGDTVRSLKASQKDGKAEKVCGTAQRCRGLKPVPNLYVAPQNEVDAAIQRLKTMKAEAEVAQKVTSRQRQFVMTRSNSNILLSAGLRGVCWGLC